jgi:hypothetical protein
MTAIAARPGSSRDMNADDTRRRVTISNVSMLSMCGLRRCLTGCRRDMLDVSWGGRLCRGRGGG